MADEKNNKSDACERFLSRYLERGFGVFPKKEVDRLVYALLVESGRIIDLDEQYAVSRLLKITPARAANLAYEYRLVSKPAMAPDELRNQFGQLLKKTSLGRVHGRVALEVRDRLLREEIEQKIQKLNLGAPDYSFNRNLLLLDYPTLSALVVEFISAEALKRLENDLKRAKDLPRDLPTGKELIAQFLERAAGKAGEKTAEKIIDIADIVLTGGTGTLISIIKKYL